MNMIKIWGVLFCIVVCSILPFKSSGQEAARLPAKLQIAVEPEAIVLTKGITVGSAEKTIRLVIRETSSSNPAKLELAARPFTDMNTGDILDASVVTVNIAAPQVALAPGGLQRVELTIGGFQQAGSYLGGLTVHDTVSGEQREIPMRVSIKDAWEFPAGVLLAAVLMASGVNHWTKKGRRKNRFDHHIAELQKTIKLAGGEGNTLLFEAEQLLAKAQGFNQEYQFARTEAALAAVAQKLAQYEQRQQGGERLRQKIRELLQEARELGESDPQSAKIRNELLKIAEASSGGFSDYDQTAALVKQLETFLRAYRLTKQDLQAAREKLLRSGAYVKKAEHSKLELLCRDIERILRTANRMSALDEANALLQKAAYELSPENVQENLFRAQQFQRRLDQYQPQIKQISGAQAARIVTIWHDNAAAALADNRFADVEEALARLEQTLTLVERIKRAEQQIKGRDPKMTELRRILRDCKNALEATAWEAIPRAEHDVRQVEELLDGRRAQYEPWTENQERKDEPLHSDMNNQERKDASLHSDSSEPAGQLRPVTLADLRQNLARLLEDAGQYPQLRGKMAQWQAYGDKLSQFEELPELFEYLHTIRAELALYARIQAIRAQAEAKPQHAALKLAEQAEQSLLAENQAEREQARRAEVLADAAQALLDEQAPEREFEQVLAYVRSPKTATNIVAYGTLASYFVVATVLGFQILYVPDPDFGALAFKDYLSLVLWALGLEGAKITVTNVYEAYFKKEG